MTYLNIRNFLFEPLIVLCIPWKLCCYNKKDIGNFHLWGIYEESANNTWFWKKTSLSKLTAQQHKRYVEMMKHFTLEDDLLKWKKLTNTLCWYVVKYCVVSCKYVMSTMLVRTKTTTLNHFTNTYFLYYYLKPKL